MALPAPPYQTAGWYPDPEGSSQRRWWNGVAWTTDFQTDAATPSPAVASGPAEKMAEAQALIASLPGYADRPVPTLAQANRSVSVVVSLGFGLSLAAGIFAVANIGDPPVFGILGIVAVIAAYIVLALCARLRFLRTPSKRVFAVLGGFIATCSLGLVIATAALGWHVSFATAGSGSIQSLSGITAPQTHADELATLKKLTAAWQAGHTRLGTWPATARVEHGVIVSSYGSTGIHVPAGWTFAYTPTPDLLGYTVSLTDQNGVGEMFDQEQGLYGPTS